MAHLKESFFIVISAWLSNLSISIFPLSYFIYLFIACFVSFYRQSVKYFRFHRLPFLHLPLPLSFLIFQLTYHFFLIHYFLFLSSSSSTTYSLFLFLFVLPTYSLTLCKYNLSFFSTSSPLLPSFFYPLTPSSSLSSFSTSSFLPLLFHLFFLYSSVFYVSRFSPPPIPHLSQFLLNFRSHSHSHLYFPPLPHPSFRRPLFPALSLPMACKALPKRDADGLTERDPDLWKGRECDGDVREGEGMGERGGEG